MKLTLIAEHPDGQTVTINGEADTMIEVMELVRAYLMGAGFGEKAVNDYLGE